MIMSNVTVLMNDLLIQHGIHPNFWGRFRALVNEGTRPSTELETRLETCTNYAECLNAILDRLSEPVLRLSKFATLLPRRVIMSEPTEVRRVTATDFLGKTIVAGDRVTYPVRRGSRMWLNKLIVKSVNDTPNGPTISGVNDSGRLIHVRNLLNCVVAND